MTYDAASVVSKFHREKQLNYPLLRDEDARHVVLFEVLDTHYSPGDSGYGVPRPGILYIAPDGVVRGKFAVPGFRERPPFGALFQALDDAVRER